MAHDEYMGGETLSIVRRLAAVMAAKPLSMFETVNDVYGEVVNFFRVLRDHALCAELLDRVAFTPYAHSEFIAAADPGNSPLERAWGFFVRMQMAVVPGRTGWSYSVGGASAKKANKPGRWATMPEHIKTISRRIRPGAGNRLADLGIA